MFYFTPRLFSTTTSTPRLPPFILSSLAGQKSFYRLISIHIKPAFTINSRHRNPPGQGYPTGVLTLPYSGSEGQRSLLTRPVTLPGSGQGTLQGRIKVETV